MAADTPAPASPAATEMAPCPWCECLDTDIWFGPRGARFVHCNLCGADGPAEAFERPAVEAWNRRATPDLAALRAERDRLLRFLSRAFAVLYVMAGEGMFFAGTEDPADILMEYAATVDPEADYRDILKALAARAALAEGRADG